MDERLWPTLRRAATNTFIVLYAVAVTAWSLPDSPAPYRAARCYNTVRQSVNHIFGTVLSYCGLWQGWNMFAPEPLALNLDVEAEITFRDGSKKYWLFPRMNELGYLTRYQKERYRKWRERVRLDECRVVWDDTARMIARMYYSEANPPVSVTLMRYWTEIPPPAPQDYQPIPAFSKRDNHYLFHRYLVRAGDLP